MINSTASEISAALTQSIERACDPSSPYWAMYGHPKNRKVDREIEIRIDVAEDLVPTFAPPNGWVVAKIKPDGGMIFLRRYQPITRPAVRALIVEAITLAHQHGGRFHSWMRDPAAWSEVL
jgi:hypothetical protein